MTCVFGIRKITPATALFTAMALITALLSLAPPPARAAAPRPAGTTTELANFDAGGNQVTRYDTDGNAVDAHDGAIQRFGDTYYLYGTSYDCGYQWQVNNTFCGFKVYSSPDLAHWTDRGYAAKPRDCKFCFRPHTVHNKATGKYVMWVNDQEAADRFRVYTADRPTGPFTEKPVPDLPSATPCTADLDVFIDDDGTGYLACSNAGWHIAVIKLTPDYLRVAGPYAVTGVTRVEAPSLFKRNGTYYLTMSDPNCGYCVATGTSYLTAKSPLGPWHGRDAWTVEDGALVAKGGLYGLSQQGDDWTDYTYSFDVAPLPASSGTAAQAGFSVRMNRDDHGYLFLLSGSGTGNGKLSVLRRAGSTTASHVVTLDKPVVAGEWHHVSVTAAGSTLTTSIDGVQVDSYTDATYPAGKVGVREWNGAALESARFDNVRVTSADGRELLADDFSGDLSKWIVPTPGVKISDDSCGGQPAQVATLRQRRGDPTYLYFSDLWNFHTNEARANFYWQPLTFAADGSIEKLTCSNTRVHLDPGHAGRQRPVRGLDQGSGAAGFRTGCDIAGNVRREQRFTAGRSGRLTSLAVTAFKDGTEEGRVQRTPPDEPLTIEITDGATTLWSGSVAATGVGWAPRNLTVHPRVKVERGRPYTVRIGSATTAKGCYGLAYSDGDPYRGGTAAVSTDGGATFTAEPARDLKFFTTVERN
ncbi:MULTISPECIES: family 43 glycosylhydrolase [Thermomonosporaceae]|uniref:family 43 glycosylhydrolase n=1 Tax=Thermomonosporaceae TaxID=2012 RepID=UPI00255A70E4|nr:MULTISPECIES: family 43 glycosylhydrolase [Thermomonosporaceae]MDL4774418.1 family 43 glycosylhydrolase [Actinomadura xylanilytica]